MDIEREAMGSGDITKDYDKLDRILAELAELRGIMNAFGNEQAAMKTEIISVKTRLDSVETKLTSLETRYDSLETRFDAFEARVEKSLLETKPIWVKELDAKIDNLHSEMQKGFLEVTNRIDELSVDINKMRGSQRGFDQRLNALERQQHERL
jgi:chromosome segregation ATPase